MAHIRAGDLDRQMTVRTYIQQRDRLGAMFKAYQDDIVIWVHKRVLKTDSLNLNNQNVPIADVEFTTYWTDQITQDSELEVEGVQYYMIQPPIEMGRQEWIKMVCKTHTFSKAV